MPRRPDASDVPKNPLSSSGIASAGLSSPRRGPEYRHTPEQGERAEPIPPVRPNDQLFHDGSLVDFDVRGTGFIYGFMPIS